MGFRSDHRRLRFRVWGASHHRAAGRNAAAPAQHRGLAASIFMSIRYVGAAIPVFGIGVYARDHGMADALEFFALLTLTMGASLLMMIGAVRLRKMRPTASPDLARQPTDTTGSWDMELS